jgi:drug/metabolite transporter (DMT)-like permease
MTVQIGIALAFLCAFTTNLAFLYKHRGARRAPDVQLTHPLRSGAALFKSKWFAIGMLVALGAWILHVAALALAPLSTVQAVICGGLVMLAVLAERVFGFKVGRRQWLGVGFTALGLALLAVTLPTAGGNAHATYSHAGMIVFESGLLGAGILLVLFPKLGAPHHHHGVLFGTAAGILFGVSDVAIKALTGAVGDHGVMGLASPWLLTCIAASVIAFFASARGLQKGDAVPVITTTSAAANVTAIAGGISVFGDPLPGDTLGLVVQMFAFVLVIAAAALTPAPLRAASAAPAR